MSQDVQHLANRNRILKPVNELGNISYARINDLQPTGGASSKAGVDSPSQNGASYSENPAAAASLSKNKMIKSSERLEKYQKASANTKQATAAELVSIPQQSGSTKNEMGLDKEFI